MERKQDDFGGNVPLYLCTKLNIALHHLNQITQLNSVSSVLGLTATLVPDGQRSADPLYLSLWQQKHRTRECQRALKFISGFVSLV